MIYVVDLDDTLVSSTNLNNDAYNFALECYNFDRLCTNERITRKNLNFISKPVLQDIISIKQSYFCQEWLPYRIVLNKLLISKLKQNHKKNCYLWTKANKNRANKIVTYCKLDLYFKEIIYDEKLSFKSSISRLKSIINSNQFIIYENNKKFFENQNCRIIDNIKDKFFDINGYLIN